MERIAALHSRLQLTVGLLLAALLLWGLFCLLRAQVSRGFLAGLWVAQLLLLAQALLGGLLLVAGARAPALHLVYGAVILAVIPGARSYVGARAGRREALILSGVCLFLLALLIRTGLTAA
jgi:hypothetical protein